MARLRFPGRPGYRFDRIGVRYGADEASQTTDPTLAIVASIHRGLRHFRDLFGDSDEEEEFHGFSSNEISAAENKVRHAVKEEQRRNEKQTEELNVRYQRSQARLADYEAAGVYVPQLKGTFSKKTYQKLVATDLVTDARSKLLNRTNFASEVADVVSGRIELNKKNCNLKQIKLKRLTHSIESQGIVKRKKGRPRKQFVISNGSGDGPTTIERGELTGSPSLFASAKPPSRYKSAAQHILAKATKHAAQSSSNKVRKFILPTKSSRSSRVIKPNKRFLEEDNVQNLVECKQAKFGHYLSPPPSSSFNSTFSLDAGDATSTNSFSAFTGQGISLSPLTANREKGFPSFSSAPQPSGISSFTDGFASGQKPLGLLDRPLIVEGKRPKKPSLIMRMKLVEDNPEDEILLQQQLSDVVSPGKPVSSFPNDDSASDDSKPFEPASSSPQLGKVFALGKSLIAPAKLFTDSTKPSPPPGFFKHKKGDHLLSDPLPAKNTVVLRQAKLQLNRTALNRSKAALARSLKAQLKREAKLERRKRISERLKTSSSRAASSIGPSSHSQLSPFSQMSAAADIDRQKSGLFEGMSDGIGSFSPNGVATSPDTSASQEPSDITVPEDDIDTKAKEECRRSFEELDHLRKQKYFPGGKHPCLVCGSTCRVKKNRKLPMVPFCKPCKKFYFFQINSDGFKTRPRLCHRYGYCVSFCQPRQNVTPYCVYCKFQKFRAACSMTSLWKGESMLLSQMTMSKSSTYKPIPKKKMWHRSGSSIQDTEDEYIPRPSKSRHKSQEGKGREPSQRSKHHSGENRSADSSGLKRTGMSPMSNKELINARNLDKPLSVDVGDDHTLGGLSPPQTHTPSKSSPDKGLRSPYKKGSKSTEERDSDNQDGDEDSTTRTSSRGPRIKHVCRRAAMVFPQQRATFPEALQSGHVLTLSALPNEEKEQILARSKNESRKARLSVQEESSDEATAPEPADSPQKTLSSTKEKKSSSIKKTFQKETFSSRKKRHLREEQKRLLSDKRGLRYCLPGKRRVRCQKCDGCKTPECGECINCKDKAKFGGPNKLRRVCIKSICLAPHYTGKATQAFINPKSPRENGDDDDDASGNFRPSSKSFMNGLGSRGSSARLSNREPANYQSLDGGSGREPADSEEEMDDDDDEYEEYEEYEAEVGRPSKQEHPRRCGLDMDGSQIKPRSNYSNNRTGRSTKVPKMVEATVQLALADVRAPNLNRLGDSYVGKLGGLKGRGDKLSRALTVDLPLVNNETAYLSEVSLKSHLIRADYRVDYNLETAWYHGFSLTITGTSCVRTLCFLCGSAGKDELIFCIVCCQPYHSFCLDDDERPEDSGNEEDGEESSSDEQHQHHHSSGLTWCCRRCQFCNVCGQQNGLLKCHRCRDMYHPECLGPNYPTKPSKKKNIWVCTKCVRCKSCGATTPGVGTSATWTYDFSLCYECGKLMDKGNFCPVCHKCYSDDDWESKMIHCVVCDSWVHAKCEELTDEMYQLLACLPDDIQFTCRVCSPEKMAFWEQLLKSQFAKGLLTVFNCLMGSKCTQSLMEAGPPRIKALKGKPTDNCMMTNCISAEVGENETHSPTTSNHTGTMESGSTPDELCMDTNVSENVASDTADSCNNPIVSKCSLKNLTEEGVSSQFPSVNRGVMSQRPLNSDLGSVDSTMNSELHSVGSASGMCHSSEIQRRDRFDTTSCSQTSSNQSSPLYAPSSPVIVPIIRTMSPISHDSGTTELNHQPRDKVQQCPPMASRPLTSGDGGWRGENVFSSQCGTVSSQEGISDLAIKHYNSGNALCSTSSGLFETKSCVNNSGEDDAEPRPVSSCNRVGQEQDDCDPILMSRDISQKKSCPSPLPSMQKNNFSKEITHSSDVSGVQQKSTPAYANCNGHLGFDSRLRPEFSPVVLSNNSDASLSLCRNSNDDVSVHNNNSDVTSTIQCGSMNSQRKDAESNVIANSMCPPPSEHSFPAAENKSNTLCTQSVAPLSAKDSNDCAGKDSEEEIETQVQNKMDESSESVFTSVAEHNLTESKSSILMKLNSYPNEEDTLQCSNEISGALVPIKPASSGGDQANRGERDHVSFGTLSPVVLNEAEVDPDRPRDFHAVRIKIQSEVYSCVEEFSEDMVHIIQSTLKENQTTFTRRKQANSMRSIFIKQMERTFPWFNINTCKLWEHNRGLPEGMLKDAVLPPYSDHTYAQWLERQNIPMSPQPSPFKHIRSPMWPSSGDDLSPNETTLLENGGAISGNHLTLDDSRYCLLCGMFGDGHPQESGRLLYCGQNEWIHIHCALWSAEVFEAYNGALQNVHETVNRGKKLRCNLCHQVGATVGCCEANCPANYHFMCARQDHCIFQEDKRMFCKLHADCFDAEVIKDKRFETQRRVCVDIDRIRNKSWSKAVDPSSLSVLFGSCTVEKLGELRSSLSDTEDCLLPIGFTCTRIYWSAQDARRRCVYTCRIIEVKPETESSELHIKDIRVVHDEKHPDFVPYDQLNLNSLGIPNFNFLSTCSAASKGKGDEDLLCLGSSVSTSLSTILVSSPNNSVSQPLYGPNSKQNNLAAKSVDLSGLSASTLALLNIKDPTKYIPPNRRDSRQGPCRRSSAGDNEDLGLVQIAHRLNRAASKDGPPQRSSSVEGNLQGKALKDSSGRCKSLTTSPIMFQGSRGAFGMKLNSPDIQPSPMIMRFPSASKNSSPRARSESPLAGRKIYEIIPAAVTRSVSLSPPVIRNFSSRPALAEDKEGICLGEDPLVSKEVFSSSIVTNPIIEVSESEDEESMVVENACKGSTSDLLPQTSSNEDASLISGMPRTTINGDDENRLFIPTEARYSTQLSPECIQSILKSVPQDMLEGDEVKVVVLTDTEDMSEEDLINMASAALGEAKSDEGEEGGDGNGDGSGKSSSEENCAENSSTPSNSEDGSQLISQSAVSANSTVEQSHADVSKATEEDVSGFPENVECPMQEEFEKSESLGENLGQPDSQDEGSFSVTEQTNTDFKMCQPSVIVNEMNSPNKGASHSSYKEDEDDDDEEEEDNGRRRRYEEGLGESNTLDLSSMETKKEDEEENDNETDESENVTDESTNINSQFERKLSAEIACSTITKNSDDDSKETVDTVEVSLNKSGPCDFGESKSVSEVVDRKSHELPESDILRCQVQDCVPSADLSISDSNPHTPSQSLLDTSVSTVCNDQSHITVRDDQSHFDINHQGAATRSLTEASALSDEKESLSFSFRSEVEQPREKSSPVSLPRVDSDENVLGASIIDVINEPSMDDASISGMDLEEEGEVIELSGLEGESGMERIVEDGGFDHGHIASLQVIADNQSPATLDLQEKVQGEECESSASDELFLDTNEQNLNSEKNLKERGDKEKGSVVRVAETTDEESDYLVLEDLSFDETHDEDGNEGEKKGREIHEKDDDSAKASCAMWEAGSSKTVIKSPQTAFMEKPGLEFHSSLPEECKDPRELSPLPDSHLTKEPAAEKEGLDELPEIIGDVVKSVNESHSSCDNSPFHEEMDEAGLVQVRTSPDQVYNSSKSDTDSSQHDVIDPESYAQVEENVEDEIESNKSVYNEGNEIAKRGAINMELPNMEEKSVREEINTKELCQEKAIEEETDLSDSSVGRRKASDNSKKALKEYPLRRRSSRGIDYIKYGSVSDSEALTTNKPSSVLCEKRYTLSDCETKANYVLSSKGKVKKMSCLEQNYVGGFTSTENPGRVGDSEARNLDVTNAEYSFADNLEASGEMQKGSTTENRQIDRDTNLSSEQCNSRSDLPDTTTQNEEDEMSVLHEISQSKTDDAVFHDSGGGVENTKVNYIARNPPKDKGPYKCPTCKRLYRTLDSYHSHVEICDFEVSTSEEEETGGAGEFSKSPKEPFDDKPSSVFNLLPELRRKSQAVPTLVDVREPLSIIITDDFKDTKFSPLSRDLSDDGSSVHSQDSKRSLRRSTLTQRNVAPAHLAKVRMRDSKSTVSPDSTCSSLLSPKSAMARLEEKVSPKETMLEAVGLVSRRSLDAALSPTMSDGEVAGDSIARRTRTMKLQPRVSPTAMAVAPRREKKSPAQASSSSSKLSIMAGGLKKEEKVKEKGVMIAFPEVDQEIQIDASKHNRRQKRQKRVWYIEETESSDDDVEVEKEDAFVLENDNNERGVAGRTRHSRTRLSLEVKPTDEKKSKVTPVEEMDRDGTEKVTDAFKQEVEEVATSRATNKKKDKVCEIGRKLGPESVATGNGKMRSRSRQRSCGSKELDEIGGKGNDDDEVDAAALFPGEVLKCEVEEPKACGKITDSNDSEDALGANLRRSRRPSNKTAKLNEYLAILKGEKEEGGEAEACKNNKESNEPLLSSPPEKRGRGRPRINPVTQASLKTFVEKKTEEKKDVEKIEKRGRGRPRKLVSKTPEKEELSKDFSNEDRIQVKKSENIEDRRSDEEGETEDMKVEELNEDEVLKEETLKSPVKQLDRRRSSLRSGRQNQEEKACEKSKAVTFIGNEINRKTEDSESKEKNDTLESIKKDCDRRISTLPMGDIEKGKRSSPTDAAGNVIQDVNKSPFSGYNSDTINGSGKEDFIDLTKDDTEKNVSHPSSSQTDLQKVLPQHVTDAMRTSGQKLKIVVRSPNVEAAQKIGELLRKTAMNLTSPNADVSVTMTNIPVMEEKSSENLVKTPSLGNDAETKDEGLDHKSPADGAKSLERKIPTYGHVLEGSKSKHDPETPLISRSESPDSISAAYDIQSDDFSSETSNDAYDAPQKTKDFKIPDVANNTSNNNDSTNNTYPVSKIPSDIEEKLEDSDDDVIIGEAHGLQPPDPSLRQPMVQAPLQMEMNSRPSFPNIPSFIRSPPPPSTIVTLSPKQNSMSLTSTTLVSGISPQSHAMQSLSSSPFVVSEVLPGRYVIQSAQTKSDFQPKQEISPSSVMMQATSGSLLQNSPQSGMLLQTQPPASIANSPKSQPQRANLLLQHTSPPGVILQQPANPPTQSALPVGSILPPTGGQPGVSFLTLSNPRLITPQLSLQSLNQGSILPSALNIPTILQQPTINANQSLLHSTVNTNQTLLQQPTVNVSQSLMSLLGAPSVYVSNLIQQQPSPSPQHAHLISTIGGLPLASPVGSQNPGNQTFNSPTLNLAPHSAPSLSSYHPLQQSPVQSSLSVAKTTVSQPPLTNFPMPTVYHQPMPLQSSPSLLSSSISSSQSVQAMMQPSQHQASSTLHRLANSASRTLSSVSSANQVERSTHQSSSSSSQSLSQLDTSTLRSHTGADGIPTSEQCSRFLAHSQPPSTSRSSLQTSMAPSSSPEVTPKAAVNLQSHTNVNYMGSFELNSSTLQSLMSPPGEDNERSKSILELIKTALTSPKDKVPGVEVRAVMTQTPNGPKRVLRVFIDEDHLRNVRTDLDESPSKGQSESQQPIMRDSGSPHQALPHQSGLPSFTKILASEPQSTNLGRVAAASEESNYVQIPISQSLGHFSSHNSRNSVQEGSQLRRPLKSVHSSQATKRKFAPSSQLNKGVYGPESGPEVKRPYMKPVENDDGTIRGSYQQVVTKVLQPALEPNPWRQVHNKDNKHSSLMSLLASTSTPFPGRTTASPTALPSFISSSSAKLPPPSQSDPPSVSLLTSSMQTQAHASQCPSPLNSSTDVDASQIVQQQQHPHLLPVATQRPAPMSPHKRASFPAIHTEKSVKSLASQTGTSAVVKKHMRKHMLKKIRQKEVDEGQVNLPVQEKKKRRPGPHRMKPASTEGAHSLIHYKKSGATLPQPSLEEEVVATPLDVDSGRDHLHESGARSQPPGSESRLRFEITSEDGFSCQGDTMEEAWNQVIEKVKDVRAASRMKQLSYAGISGRNMFGVDHDAVVYLIEQLYGAVHCHHNYKYRFHRYDHDLADQEVPLNASGSARSEIFLNRKPYDMFNFLKSLYRIKPGDEEREMEEEMALKSARRATSMSLPMAMRFRKLKTFAKEAVDVYRSKIHGRGLFCKRNIDAGEMVIEYAGEVIRASLTDKREKYYESKGIGCYMFRIDDDEVIDATMHGSAARFINHSCEPNCFSKVIQVDGKKHIVIFAMRPIKRGEELTYDYKFPIEEVKIPCHCGSKRCRKYLN